MDQGILACAPVEQPAMGHNRPPAREDIDRINPWGAGGELIPQGEAALAHPELADAIRRSPDKQLADGSLARCLLAREAGVLTLALATAESEQAENMSDRLVAHQLAASHALAMRFTGRTMRALDAAAAGTESAEAVALRAARVASRMIHTYRSCYELIEQKRLKRWQRMTDENRVRWLIAEGRAGRGDG
jgi:hypothetical protein